MKNAIWTGDNQDSGVLSTPLSFLRSGYFAWDIAGLYFRGGYGYYWSLRSGNTTSSSYLDLRNAYFNPQDNYPRGYGDAVCLRKQSNGLVASLPILYVQKAGNYLLTKATNPSTLSLILAIL